LGWICRCTLPRGEKGRDENQQGGRAEIKEARIHPRIIVIQITKRMMPVPMTSIASLRPGARVARRRLIP